MITPETPHRAVIVDVERETSEIKTFTVKLVDPRRQKKFFFLPGKFMMVSIFGFGEMPISISSSPYKTDSIAFTVANVGNISNAMHQLRAGDEIGLRGPFGKGFPLPSFRKKNLVFVAGGCGFAPLRSSVYAFREKQQEFGDAFVFFGCKSPNELLFKRDLLEWEKEQKIQVLVTVDEPSPTWRGYSGVVTKLFSKVELPVDNTVCLMCGPPTMIRFTLIELRKLGFQDKQMFASLERVMHCGVGYCSHCNIGEKYACIDGPVFRADQLKEMPMEEE